MGFPMLREKRFSQGRKSAAGCAAAQDLRPGVLESKGCRFPVQALFPFPGHRTGCQALPALGASGFIDPGITETLLIGLHADG
jgi:hypothetical protein